MLKAGYEVLYLVEAVDEYAISALPEFEGKKFQNVAKEGFTMADCKLIKVKVCFTLELNYYIIAYSRRSKGNRRKFQEDIRTAVELAR